MTTFIKVIFIASTMNITTACLVPSQTREMASRCTYIVQSFKPNFASSCLVIPNSFRNIYKNNDQTTFRQLRDEFVTCMDWLEALIVDYFAYILVVLYLIYVMMYPLP